MPPEVGYADEQAHEEPMQVVSSTVELWTNRIKSAKRYWDADFKRMRENMNFVAGYQWDCQEELRDKRYVTNLTLRLMRQKVASLYAKNPKIVPQRRRRMEFQIWDGRMESLQQAVAVSTSPEARPEDLLASAALLMDFVRGRQQRDVVDKVASTLEHLFSWSLDNQTPEFKLQAKQLVRRAVVTGVGYLRIHFEREGVNYVNTVNQGASLQDRAQQAQVIVNKILKGEIDEESPEFMRLQTLITSTYGIETEQGQVQERLCFDFPQSTTIIPDKKCRALKGFVGARWIAQEYYMTFDEVEAQYGKDIGYNAGTTVKYTQHGQVTHDSSLILDKGESYDPDECYACVWEVFDQRTRTRFTICEGYNDYLEEPQAMWPEFKNFWPIFALTFNETEVEDTEGVKASIFPPSDVDIAKSPQKEWNESREELSKHRDANRPLYGYASGSLSDDDKEALRNGCPNEVIEIKTAQPGADISKIVQPFVRAPIDPNMYDTGPLVQDLSASLGNEEATVPASDRSTATASTINEQNRMVTTASDVDDLDEFLATVAEAGGEILLRECSMETVQRVVGIGAVWPTVDQAEYVNYIYLTILASSSGRPNKALEIANFQQIAPILLQAGASPYFIIREALKRLDDRLDIDEAFPFGPGQSAMAVPMTPQTPAAADSTAQPNRGTVAPTRQGQGPAGTVPRPNVERPQIEQ